MNEFECVRAQMIMVEFVDGDLAADTSAWLQGHLETCDECRGALARLKDIDSELIGFGERVESGSAALRFENHFENHAAHRKVALGLAVAAALTFAVIAPYRKAAVTNRPATVSEGQFVSIPYLAPLDPRENATIVRMDIQVATLLAVGYRMTADPDTVVPADVLVGEDGRAHAVRMLSDVTLNGAGD